VAYVKNNDKFKVGEWVYTTRQVNSCGGYFEKGTEVRIARISERGYDLVDKYGNRIIETGFDSVRK
jgi:hypothetical protein